MNPLPKLTWRLRRIIYPLWFASAMMGMAGYFIASIFNDFADLTDGVTDLPLWVRVLTGVICGVVVRLGIALDMHRISIALKHQAP